eukprot:scaffold16206_cov134-Isochrysis_galbana.AAC.4
MKLGSSPSLPSPPPRWEEGVVGACSSPEKGGAVVEVGVGVLSVFWLQSSGRALFAVGGSVSWRLSEKATGGCAKGSAWKRGLQLSAEEVCVMADSIVCTSARLSLSASSVVVLRLCSPS